MLTHKIIYFKEHYIGVWDQRVNTLKPYDSLINLITVCSCYRADLKLAMDDRDLHCETLLKSSVELHSKLNVDIINYSLPTM